VPRELTKRAQKIYPLKGELRNKEKVFYEEIEEKRTFIAINL